MSGQQEFRGERIILAEWARRSPSDFVLRDSNFIKCVILGPAVLLPGPTSRMQMCSFDPREADALFWRLGAGQEVIGAVGADNCTFDACSFYGVGIAGTDQYIEAFRLNFL